VKRSIEKRKERGEFLMLYAANQFDKLICFKNSSESEPRHKERCLYLKVSSLMIIYCDLIDELQKWLSLFMSFSFFFIVITKSGEY